MSLALKQSKARMGRSAQSGAMISRRAFMGDPGIFGFLGKAAGGLLKTVGKATGLISEPAPPPTPQFVPQQRQTAFSPIQQRPTGINPPFGGPPGAGFGLPGTDRRIGFGEPTGRPQPGTKLACPSGFHPNKSDYFLKDGTFVAQGTKCVKNRRTNPLNPKALSRSIRRLEQGKRAVKRLDRVAIKCKRCGYSKCRC